MLKQVTLTLGISFAIGSLLLPLGAYAAKKDAKDSGKVQVAEAAATTAAVATPSTTSSWRNTSRMILPKSKASKNTKPVW